MAEKQYSVQIVNKREDGTLDKLNPITKSANVKVTPQNNIPEDVTDLAKLLNLLGALSFKNTEINDEVIVDDQAWSSAKINNFITDILKRLQIVEDYLAQQESIEIDGETVLLPTVCGIVDEEEMSIQMKAATVEGTTICIV